MSKITIPIAVRKMLAVVDELCNAYPKKKFTLDGRLVGDIGEILVEEAYQLELFPDMQKHHDAKTSDGRLVQIKASMRGKFSFPCDHIPSYYLAVHVHPDGSFDEIFNGPGEIAWQAVMNRKLSKTNLHQISAAALRHLQEKVQAGDRIPLRTTIVRPDQSKQGT
ncbi:MULTISPECIES: hypothetical protein [unclassified Pseudoxanthomonas]|jgi:hypothetical protein|uniref:DUF6998 domain-containing protein n=1 Tax=unclassified Pseudoxanthomonas TaxID=2645906 RepID=UPI003077B77E